MAKTGPKFDRISTMDDRIRLISSYFASYAHEDLMGILDLATLKSGILVKEAIVKAIEDKDFNGKLTKQKIIDLVEQVIV